MLYTFTVTEDRLIAMEHYLDSIYLERPREHVMGVQRSLVDDQVWVIIDCEPETATFLYLLAG